MTKTFHTAIRDFLVRERTLGRRPRPASPARRKRNRQRGVALIAVMIAIAITLVITSEFGTSTNGDLLAAANYRDQMRAHFLARSAINLSELVIRVQQRIDNFPDKSISQAGIRITDFADQVLLAFCGNPEQVQSMVGLSPGDVKGLGVDIGTCGIVARQITTEDDKINVNCANSGINNTAAKTLQAMIGALIYFPAYDPVFEEADAENYRRDRATQASAIVDYIDSDNARLTGGPEDYGYENLKDSYKAKNNYIDTAGELQLVRGVDDRFWTLFGPAFTAYGGCKVNLGAVSNTQLIAAIIYLAAKHKNDPMLADPIKLFLLAGMVAQAKQFGMSFNKPQEFIDFVKDPGAALGLLAGTGSLAGSAAGAALAAGIPALAGQKLGLELDLNALNQIAGTGPRRTYRVEAFGEIERKQKAADGSPVFPAIRSTITGVWDTKVVPQHARKPTPNGAWVFMRED